MVEPRAPASDLAEIDLAQREVPVRLA